MVPESLNRSHRRILEASGRPRREILTCDAVGEAGMKGVSEAPP